MIPGAVILLVPGVHPSQKDLYLGICRRLLQGLKGKLLRQAIIFGFIGCVPRIFEQLVGRLRLREKRQCQEKKAINNDSLFML